MIIRDLLCSKLYLYLSQLLLWIYIHIQTIHYTANQVQIAMYPVVVSRQIGRQLKIIDLINVLKLNHI